MILLEYALLVCELEPIQEEGKDQKQIADYLKSLYTIRNTVFELPEPVAL